MSNIKYETTASYDWYREPSAVESTFPGDEVRESFFDGAPTLLREYHDKWLLGGERPFEIRGHHIELFARLIGEPSTPQLLAQSMREMASNYRGDTSSETVNLEILTNPENRGRQYYSAYGYDIVGETPEQADQFQANIEKTLSDFTSRPDSALVKLTELPDAVCAGCIFGNHCSRQSAGQITHDKFSIYVFKDMTADAGLMDSLGVVTEGYNRAKSLLTTVGALRTVLQPRPNEETQPVDDYAQRLEQTRQTVRGPAAVDRFLRTYLNLNIEC